MLGGWIGQLGSYDPRLPVIIYGSVVVFAGVMALKLPETASTKLPDTIEESEKIGLAKICDKKRQDQPETDGI